MSEYAFFFDSSSCSGCKACQAACKDKHALPVGMLWRRVYEVSGGDWRQEGAAWISDAYAYNLSIACNHCQQPVCVEVCPTTALYRRPDGLVLIDPQRCIGCRYCSWVCPYGAPQYDPDERLMTKCTGCVDYLEAGLPPACVAACPLRVLDFGDQTAMQTRYAVHGNGLVQAVAPLPEEKLTQPGLLIRPHRDAERAAQGQPRLANLEEVHTASVQDERPLVLFTVLAQMAAGAWITLGLSRLPSPAAVPALPVLVVGVIMAAAMLLSLLHLGQPLRAYRAVANWRTSWLSREILSASVFTAGLAAFFLLQRRYPAPGDETAWLDRLDAPGYIFYLTALAGLGLVFSISRVYRLRTVAAWDHWRTSAAFLITPLLLGPLLAGALLFLDSLPVNDFFSNTAAVRPLLPTLALVVLLAGTAQWIVSWPERWVHRRLAQLRLGLLAASALAAALVEYLLSQSPPESAWSTVGALLLLSFSFALASELLGRWMFFQKKAHSGL